MVLWEEPAPGINNIFIIRSNRAGVVLRFRKLKNPQITLFPDQRSRNVYFFSYQKIDFCQKSLCLRTIFIFRYIFKVRLPGFTQSGSFSYFYLFLLLHNSQLSELVSLTSSLFFFPNFLLPSPLRKNFSQIRNLRKWSILTYLFLLLEDICKEKKKVSFCFCFCQNQNH